MKYFSLRTSLIVLLVGLGLAVTSAFLEGPDWLTGAFAGSAFVVGFSGIYRCFVWVIRGEEDEQP